MQKNIKPLDGYFKNGMLVSSVNIGKLDFLQQFI